MVFQPTFDLRGQNALDWIADHTPDITWQTESGTSIAETYRSIGFRFGNQAFFDMRRDILEQVRFVTQLADLDPDRLIPVAFEITKIGSQFKRERSYRFIVSGSDLDTGEQVERSFNLSSDTRLTKAQAEGAIFGVLLADRESGGMLIEDVRLVDVFRSIERRRG